MNNLNCESLSITELCRLCLGTEESLISVLELLEESEFLLEKIYTCLLVEISDSDEVSRKVCRSCLDKVESFYSFRHLVADSQEKLARLLSTNKQQQPPPSSAYLQNVDTHDIEAELERELNSKGNDCWVSGDDLVSRVICDVEQRLPGDKFSQDNCKRNDNSKRNDSQASPIDKSAHECVAASDKTRDLIHRLDPESGLTLCSDSQEQSEEQRVEGEELCSDEKPARSSPQGAAVTGGFSLTSLAETSLLDAFSADPLPFGVEEEGNCEDPLDLRCNIGSENSVLDSFSFKEKKKHNKTRHRCSGCSKTLGSLQGLLKHINKHHAKNHGHVCHKCNIGFKSAEQLKVHNWTHREKYTCDKCPYTSHAIGNFKLHVMKHNREFLVVCEDCGKGFYRVSSYEEHKANKHGRDIVVHKCAECGKAYHSRGYLRQHLKTHRPDFCRSDYQCETCGKTYLSLKGIRRHVASAHEGNRYRCKVCSKEVTSLQSLKTHEKIHTGEKSYVCDTCGKTFLRLNSLVVHRRVHSGEKPYTCDVCQKCFSQRSTLNIHKRSHTGERPYPCHICPKSFVTKTLRNSHLKTHRTEAFN